MFTLYSADNSKLMEIEALERSGNDLLIKVKVFGAMPMTARLSPSEARKGLKLVVFKLAWFLLTFLLRLAVGRFAYRPPRGARQDSPHAVPAYLSTRVRSRDSGLRGPSARAGRRQATLRTVRH